MNPVVKVTKEILKEDSICFASGQRFSAFTSLSLFAKETKKEKPCTSHSICDSQAVSRKTIFLGERRVK